MERFFLGIASESKQSILRFCSGTNCFVAGASRNDETRELRNPEKITFADLHPVVAQDAVRGRRMEEEVRKYRAVDIDLTRQRHRVGRSDREGHLLRFGTLELRGLERPEIVDRLRNPLAQFLERRLGV